MQNDDKETKVTYASLQDGVYVRNVSLSLLLFVYLIIAISSDWEMCWTNELC